MGLLGWMFYIVMGIVFFLIIKAIQNKYTITKVERIIFSLILLMIVSGFCFRFGLNYTNDIFLIFIFLMITDIIYTSYFIERDFFDKNEKNIRYYIVLLIIGFIINEEFINNVTQVFLTGEDLRIVLWLLVIIFIYHFSHEKNVLGSIPTQKEKYMSKESILVSYAKLKYKYYDQCNFKEHDLSNLVYAIMIFQSSKRSKLLRNYDNLMFKINGNPRKLGIMQVESKKFITDTESIDIVYKKLEKLYHKNEKVKIADVIKSYSKEDSEAIQYIFDIIKKF